LAESHSLVLNNLSYYILLLYGASNESGPSTSNLVLDPHQACRHGPDADPVNSQCLSEGGETMK